MLDQLAELLEMQRTLDKSILDKKGLEYNKVVAENMKVALFVELGELMNEFPTFFKHWKSNKVDNFQRGLVEYVDALHFQLSLFNYYELGIYLKYHDYNKILINSKQDIKKGLAHDPLTSLSAAMLRAVDFCDCIDGLSYLFDIGHMLGFTWEEIYKAYKEKNEVNYERIKNGY